MASPPIIVLEDWLVPIPGASPAGQDLAYDQDYDLIKNARRSEDDTNLGEWKRTTKFADWDLVLEIGEECLKSKSKDLQIAAWVTEALATKYKFAGLRDGFLLLHGIHSTFWDSYYPVIEDGDPSSRYGPFVFLNGPTLLPLLIRSITLTEGLGVENYSYQRYQESRETENLLKKSPEKAKMILANGRIMAKTFDDQVAQTNRAYYEDLDGDVKDAIRAYKMLDLEVQDRFGPEAPSLEEIGKALEDCRRFVESTLAAKRAKDPSFVAPKPPETMIPAASPDDGATPAPVVESRDGPPPADFGKVLIEFRSLAQKLAEVGVKLEENRKKHAELVAELSRLDREYEEMSRSIGGDGSTHRLIDQLLGVVPRG